MRVPVAVRPRRRVARARVCGMPYCRAHLLAVLRRGCVPRCAWHVGRRTPGRVARPQLGHPPVRRRCHSKARTRGTRAPVGVMI